jgi:hypothetical protein
MLVGADGAPVTKALREAQQRRPAATLSFSDSPAMLPRLHDTPVINEA